MEARCSCGRLVVATGAPAQFIVLCHCRACQARSGSPFGAGVYYASDGVTTSGDPSDYARPTEAGGTLRNRFCPQCGATLWWTIDAHPELIGIALGNLVSPVPDFPILSLWERSRHAWVESLAVAARHPCGLPAS